jgi:hypothetical protein
VNPNVRLGEVPGDVFMQVFPAYITGRRGPNSALGLRRGVMRDCRRLGRALSARMGAKKWLKSIAAMCSPHWQQD